MHGGKLVVFEGAEGTGKSTQVALLREQLAGAGVSAVAFREPGGTPVGDAVRAVLLDPARSMSPAAEALLFMASRAELCTRELRPALEGGLVVLLDRFFLSTYAYQSVGRGLPEQAVRAANNLATGGLVPDLTVLLDLPIADAMKRASERGSPDRMERSAADFHERVAEGFRRCVSPEWMREHPEAGPIVRIDASGTHDEVAARIADALARHLPDPFGALRSESIPAAKR